MSNSKPVQKTTLPEAIAEQILTMIVEGQFRPGDRLPTEVEMMEKFGVGRSTLREALKSLSMVGVLEARRSVGTFVSEKQTGFPSSRLNWAVPFSEREMRDIVEVRLALEGQAALLAVLRATPEQKAQVARLVDAMSDSTLNSDQITEYDTAFHLAIAEASHNPLLLNLIRIARNLLRDYMWRWLQNAADAEENVRVHRRILEAIQAGDAEQARAAMLNHLEASSPWILRAAHDRLAAR